MKKLIFACKGLLCCKFFNIKKIFSEKCNCSHFFKKLAAFSLVELMISLITISCIAAAFTPVITKKLKKQDIALSLAQTSEIKSPCPEFSSFCELCTKQYCIKCNLDTCAEGEYVDTQSCSCKNCNDKEKTGLEHCMACHKNNNEYICSKCEIEYFLEGIDGKKYTKCQPCGKDKISGKNNICPDGIKQYSPEYCNNPPAGFFCEGTTLKECSYKYDSRCNTCNSTKCLSCGAWKYISYAKDSKGTCEDCGGGCSTCSAPSVCTSCNGESVLNPINHTCSTRCTSLISNCRFCSGVTTDTANLKCTECYKGYYLSANGKSCNACSSVANCIACKHQADGKCEICKQGYYPDSNGVCTACSVANCSECTSDGKCGSCNQGYHLENGVCVSNDNKFNCSDYNFMRVGNLCVTRRNMGDASTLAIPSTVKIAEAGGEFCYSNIDKCCWKGQTTSACDSNLNGDYSGCKRTVCNWNAANEICEKFNYGGKTWRLPTADEMANWGKYSIGLGSNGLMLCAEGATDTNFTQCSRQALCRGSYDQTCIICYVWSGTQIQHTSAMGGSADIWRTDEGRWVHWGFHNKQYAFSVRCVTEMDEKK